MKIWLLYLVSANHADHFVCLQDSVVSLVLKIETSRPSYNSNSSKSNGLTSLFERISTNQTFYISSSLYQTFKLPIWAALQ